MSKRFDIACHKALNSFPENELHDIRKIQEAIDPYRAVESVVKELMKEGFVKSVYLDTYKLTPLGFENMDYYERKLDRLDKELADYKLEKIRGWISTAISAAAFVMSIIALCLK